MLMPLITPFDSFRLMLSLFLFALFFAIAAIT